MFDFPFSWSGLKIVESPPRIVPKLRINDNVPMTDEFRNEMNSWLLDMFGVVDNSIQPIGMAWQFGNTLVMRPETIAQLARFL